MPTFEVCFKVGDSNPGNHSQSKNWEDGQILAIQAPGLWWTKAELLAWANAGTEPPGFSGMPPAAKQSWNRLRLRVRRFLNPAFSRLYHVNARFGTSYTQGELDAGIAQGFGPRFDRNAECADIETGLQRQIDDITTHGGVDTNWGFSDLSLHSVVRVDATVEQLAKATREWDDDTVDVFATRKQIARRYWRIDYTAFMSAAEIAAVQDPAVLVNVDRAGAAVAVGVATTRTIRDVANNPPGSGDGSDPT